MSPASVPKELGQVAPARGAGVEIDFWRQSCIRHESRPVRGAWIERQNVWLITGEFVAPRKGACG